MNLEQIKAAVDAGKKVHWMNGAYEVIKDKLGRYLIINVFNQDCVGLTALDGVRMNGKESDFFIAQDI